MSMQHQQMPPHQMFMPPPGIPPFPGLEGFMAPPPGGVPVPPPFAGGQFPGGGFFPPAAAAGAMPPGAFNPTAMAAMAAAAAARGFPRGGGRGGMFAPRGGGFPAQQQRFPAQRGRGRGGGGPRGGRREDFRQPSLTAEGETNEDGEVEAPPAAEGDVIKEKEVDLEKTPKIEEHAPEASIPASDAQPSQAIVKEEGPKDGDNKSEEQSKNLFSGQVSSERSHFGQIRVNTASCFSRESPRASWPCSLQSRPSASPRTNARIRPRTSRNKILGSDSFDSWSKEAW